MIFYLKAYNFAQGSDLSRTHTGADVNAVPERALFRNEKTDPVLQGRRLAAERKRFLRSSLSLAPFVAAQVASSLLVLAFGLVDDLAPCLPPFGT